MARKADLTNKVLRGYFMKLLLAVLTSFTLLLLSPTEGWSLPPCSEKDDWWNNCFGTYNSDDGSKYVGEWKKGKPNGQGTKSYANGDNYVGEFRDGKTRGKGTYTYANGDKTSGEFTQIIQPFLICNDPEKLFSDGSVHLIFIDAANCSDCVEYKRNDFPKLKNSELAKNIYLTIIETEDYRNTALDKDWPEYLQWIRAKTKVHSGSPRFIVMSGRNIVANEYNNYRWRKRVIPLLTQLTGD